MVFGFKSTTTDSLLKIIFIESQVKGGLELLLALTRPASIITVYLLICSGAQVILKYRTLFHLTKNQGSALGGIEIRLTTARLTDLEVDVLPYQNKSDLFSSNILNERQQQIRKGWSWSYVAR